MRELNAGVVITVEDGELRVETYLGPKGRPEYKLAIPVIEYEFWSHAGDSAVRFTIDDSTASKLAHTIIDLAGESNE